MRYLEFYESFDEGIYAKIVFHEETGGFLVVHRGHGRSEYQSNVEIGLMLVTHGFCVVLLENIILKPTPDASIDGEMWEFKTISRAKNLRNAVQRQLRKGKSQCGNILLYINQPFEIAEITFGIYNAVKFDHLAIIQRIAILFRDGTFIEFGREEVEDKRYLKYFR